VIHVGGLTEAEMKEKKDRVEDALHATKASIESGIVPGGGRALLAAREDLDPDSSIGAEIVYRAISKPFEQILINAGVDSVQAQILSTAASDRPLWESYDLKEEQFIDFKEAGIIDPAKVTITALQNAASVAGTILLTETVIVDEPQKEEAQPGVDPSQFM
jgi:chaperonin GroEL